VGNRGLNWAWLVARTIHPIKVAIIEALRWIDRPATATDLWRSFDVEGFGQRDVAYHARKLEKMGALVEVERVPFRFVTESFYRLSDELAGSDR